MAQAVLKCPHCKKNLGNINTDDYLYGSPLKTCPKCKKEYLDPRFHEIAIDGIRDCDISSDPDFLAKKRKNGLLTILGGIGVMALFIILIMVGWIFYLFPVISIILIIGGVKTLKETNPQAIEKKRAELDQEKMRSYARMQNPQYVAQLRAYGCAVPATPNEE